MSHQTKDERTILTGRDYSRFRQRLWITQRGLCMNCERKTYLLVPIEADFSFHVAHRGSRGMDSSIRDDVVGPKRGQVEGGKCGACHRLEHHQQ